MFSIQALTLLSFESGNVIEFVQHCTQQDIDELEQTYDEMTGHKLDASFYNADYKFHEIIARGTNNPLVIAVNEMLTGVLLSSQELTNLAVGPEIGLSFHKDIISAIKNRDSQMAALLMTRHIEATIAAVELSHDQAGA